MSPRRRQDYEEEPRYSIDPAARREILAIVLFALAAISILSYFNLAASAGHFIDLILQKLFGALRPVFTLALLTLGLLYIGKASRGTTIFGAILVFLSILGLVHLIQYPGAEGYEAAKNGLGGGFVGLYLAYPIFQIFGFWATLVILLAIFFISLSLIIPQPIGKLLSSRQIIFRTIGEMLSLGSRLRSKIPDINFPSQNYNHDGTPNLTIHSVDTSSDVPVAETEENSDITENELFPRPTAALPKKRPRLPKIDMPLGLLDKNVSKPTAGDIRYRSAVIQKTLENFGLDVEMGEIAIGPTVTQYTLRPAEGIKLASITALHNDLALALAAHPIRIEAPIPGKSLVGVEVPNEKVAIVRLREILDSDEFVRRNSNLMIALGKDVAGKPWLAEISKMPHLLVAGSTGSGKTVCLNAIIVSLLYENGPSDLKFLLIDPKRVELPVYNDIPHLLTPVITDVKKTVQALRWAISEMEGRFKKLEEKGARDIKSFNEKVAPDERLPYIVIVVDELADLMVAAASEVEAYVIRLAQMSRAVGIHLILATQRPSVDVITGLIKANITSRIAFAVASLMDSRTILDCSGAEKLLGRGDMLFITSELGKPKRIQGAFVGEEEIQRVVDFLQKSGEPDYIELVPPNGQGQGNFDSMGDNLGDDDPLLSEAKETILQAGKASASLLQRRLKVGYARAARILDLLEASGFIGPADGAKPREVLKGGNDINEDPQVVLREPTEDDKIE